MTSFTSELRITLTQHLLNHLPTPSFPHSELSSSISTFEGSLSNLITQIGVAAKMISAQVRRAGIIEVWGQTGQTNIQGEEVQKLDQIANDILVDVLTQSGCVAALASEEEDNWISIPSQKQGRYIVLFDPLDGSSNIEVSTSIGTIFGIYYAPHPPSKVDDLLKAGRKMVASGYVIYGSSTVFVYASQGRVDCFTLDPMVGEFFLSRANLQYPQNLSMISVNGFNESYWDPWVVHLMQAYKDRNHLHRQITARHVGSLVADFHRNLIKGGLYLYPVDHHNQVGKLRLMYECNPLAFIAQTAGASDTWGQGSVLDLIPTHLHQRTGFYVGPKAEIALIESLYIPYIPKSTPV